MLSTTLYQTLFAYHWQTTFHLFTCASRLSQADYHVHPGYGHGSIHDLFFHLLRSDHAWRIALLTGERPARLTPENYPSLEILRTGFLSEQVAWSSYLEALSDEQIAGALLLRNPRGEKEALSLWRILQHVILHGMQHHAELAQLLTAKGQSPGNIDFIYF